MRNFASLSDIEFEKLCAGLLTRELGLHVEHFPAGRDRGIDLRWHPGTTTAGIGQCKHYVKTPYSGLFKAAKEEVAKVNKLTPSQYLFITSQDLTVGQKDELFNLFSQWMTSPADVYSGRDIDALITKHPEVEREHIKLWLNSGSELFNIINSGIVQRSARLLERAREDMTRFVYTKNFNAAKDILDADRACLIAGAPGVGKTMLAHSLIVDAALRGYEPIEISDDIEAGWKVFDANRKQFFLYDDFLGAISFSERLSKNEDKRLVEFIAKVSKSKNHFIVLTTREYILRDAEKTYERLEEIRSRTRLTLALSSYSRQAKAEILYNHLYHSDLPSVLRSQFSGDGWKSIVDHKGFSPRLIKYATSDLLDGLGEDYLTEFKAVLDNPVKLWSNAYDRHLDELQRLILRTLCTFLAVDIEQLIVAVAAHYRDGEAVTDRQIKHALRALDQSFIRTEKSGHATSVNFDSPTVREFMLSVLDEDFQSLKMLIKNAVSIRQLWVISSAGHNEAKNHFGIYGLTSSQSRFALEPIASTFIEAVVRLTQQSAPPSVRLEESLLNLLSLPIALHPAEEWWNSRFDDLKAKWKDGTGSFYDIYRLVQYPKIAELCDADRDSFSDALTNLWEKETFYDPADWNAWLDIHEEFLREDLPADTNSKFEELVENEISNSSYNEVDFDALIGIAGRLHLSELSDQLFDHQLELESQINDDGDGDGYRGDGAFDSTMSDAAIEDMFNRFN